MSLTAQKVDAIARMLLSETIAEGQKAKAELQRLMSISQETQDTETTTQIHKLLTEIGVPTCNAGHSYLIEGIRETIRDPDALKGTTLPGGLLERIAEKCGAASSYAVERGMRESIAAAWDHGNHNFQEEHFTVLSSITLTPTVRNFISRAANIVRLRMEQQ